MQWEKVYSSVVSYSSALFLHFLFSMLVRDTVTFEFEKCCIAVFLISKQINEVSHTVQHEWAEVYCVNVSWETLVAFVR